MIAMALLLGAGSAGWAAGAELANDQDKTLYALGLALANNLQNFNLTEAELAIVQDGMSDALLGRERKVDLEVYGPKIQDLGRQRMEVAAEGEKDASLAFLEQMSKEQGAERTASGLIFIPISEGSGPSPKASDTVRVHYHGTLRDGSVFDSSVKRGQPATFPLTGVIPCWTEGVQKMKVGGKSKLVCPADIAYGNRGQGPIKPGATLVFEVELLAIETPPAAQPADAPKQ
jgi:FKBP-type peptidyl-prolyl cis-trans isomerase FkpA/FKBP-type peptidyl-prolyl cis-trans isomerase FklB